MGAEDTKLADRIYTAWKGAEKFGGDPELAESKVKTRELLKHTPDTELSRLVREGLKYGRRSERGSRRKKFRE